MGKSVVLNEIDAVYTVTVIQYSNKGILFLLTDKTTHEEVDRFLWEYPHQFGETGNIRRIT